MKFACITSTAFASLIISFASATDGPRIIKKNLRNGATPVQQRSLGGNGRGRSIQECTISSISYLQIPGEDPIAGGDVEIGCDDGNDTFLPLNLDEAQARSIKSLAANGQLIFGHSKINVDGATVDDDNVVTLPPGQKISDITKPSRGGNPFDRRERQLQSGTGNKYFLLFRVTDVNGLVYGDSATVMSDKLYGTGSDTINLKTQLTACSVGKYTMIPGGRPGYDTSSLESAPGVIDITIPISIDNPRNTVRAAALDEAERVLGSYFGGSTTASLRTYADHTLFSLKQCFQECGWAAYAGVGSYYQFYQSGYYKQAGVQLHEHGHNMQLAHSGGLDGQTYTDHTCSMGNPLYGDQLGQMCFNPAKNWQMQFNPHPTTVKSGWYADEDFKVVDTANGAQTFKMIGIGEYNLQGDGINKPRKAVALQIQTGTTTPQYVAFNSAKGANAQNDEADNQVTILEYTGTGYGVSSLKGYITQGNSFTTTQGRIVTAQCINTAVTPSLACVCVRASGQTCPTTCTCEDGPVTDQPTKSPSPPTLPPTKNPTMAPTPRPTESPTKSCGNGICEAGEICIPSAKCGDGICQVGDGEDCLSCPADCNGVTSGNPNRRYCCGTSVQYAVGCGDSNQCGGAGSCTTESVSQTPYCCADSNSCFGDIESTCSNDCRGPTPAPVTPPPGSPTPIPTKSPTALPTQPTGGGNVCASTSCQFCYGGGECKSAGCTWNKGLCS